MVNSSASHFFAHVHDKHIKQKQAADTAVSAQNKTRNSTRGPAIIVRYSRAQSSEPTGATISSTAETSLQASLLREDAALQVCDCRGVWDLMAGLWLNGLFADRCRMVKVLHHQVAELWEKVSRLHSIRNYEKIS